MGWNPFKKRRARKALAKKQAKQAKQAEVAAKMNIPKTRTTDAQGKSLSWVTEDRKGQLAGKSRLAKYQGEDKKVGWRAHLQPEEAFAPKWGHVPNSPGSKAERARIADLDTMTTQYDRSTKQRERSRFKVDKGTGEGTMTHEGKIATTPADSSGWVMDPRSGAVHTFDPALQTEHKADGKVIKANRHHTSPLAGRDVAGAGMWKMDKGRITEIDDRSGHYQPESEYTFQAVRAMERQGFPLQRPATEKQQRKAGEGTNSAAVTLTGYDQIRGGKGWLKDRKDTYADDLTLPYQAFLQGQGNEVQMRGKAHMQSELLGATKKTRKKLDAKATKTANSPRVKAAVERQRAAKLKAKQAAALAGVQQTALTNTKDADVGGAIVAPTNTPNTRLNVVDDEGSFGEMETEAEDAKVGYTHKPELNEEDSLEEMETEAEDANVAYTHKPELNEEDSLEEMETEAEDANVAYTHKPELNEEDSLEEMETEAEDANVAYTHKPELNEEDSLEEMETGLLGTGDVEDLENDSKEESEEEEDAYQRSPTFN